MKQKLRSLRLHMLLPVICMTLFVVTLLTTLFSRTYTGMILRQEQEMNEAGFETVSSSVTPLISSFITAVKTMLSDERVRAYARLQYASLKDLIHGRIDCRDYLKAEIARSGGIFGVFFMRQDGSLFGVLPEGNFFLDDPGDNPLPEDIKSRSWKPPADRPSGPAPSRAQPCTGSKRPIPRRISWPPPGNPLTSATASATRSC